MKATIAGKSRTGLSISGLFIGFFLFAYILRGKATLPLDRSSLTPFHDWLNSGKCVD
ncbi:MAG: hypothetical protein WDO06_06820 [Actinomycetota bacterium]